MSSIKRRHVLTLAGLACLPAAAADRLNVWCSPDPPSSSVFGPAGYREFMFLSAGKSQVGFRAYSGMAFAGHTIYNTINLPRDAAEYRAEPHWAGIQFQDDFDTAVDQDWKPTASLPAFASTKDMKSAHVKLSPNAVLETLGNGHSRLVLQAEVDINVPGLRSSNWIFAAETAQVRPNRGTDSWIDFDAGHLRKAVRAYAGDLLLAVGTEIAMRQAGTWTEPVDTGKLVEINMAIWQPHIYWPYLPIAESERSMIVVRTQHKSLGHLWARRFALDKKLVVDIRR